jgi:hypothetical protein
MGLQFCLGPESHIALLFALIKGADIVAPSKVILERWVVRIVNCLVIVRAKMAIEMVSI